MATNISLCLLQENCVEFEEMVVAQCDALIEALENRKQQLLEYIRQDKEVKVRVLKDQVTMCTCKLQHTTGLLQFCIEALKETDSAAFLQVRFTLCWTHSDYDTYCSFLAYSKAARKELMLLGTPGQVATRERTHEFLKENL